MKREDKINAGKIWQVYPNDNLDAILFEGSRKNCQIFIRQNCPTAYRKGEIRLGKLIWESLTPNQ